MTAPKPKVIVICAREECKKPFYRASHQHIYCSEDCCTKAQCVKQKAIRDRIKDEYLNYTPTYVDKLIKMRLA